MLLAVNQELGKGRAFITLMETGAYNTCREGLCELLGARGRVLSINCKGLTPYNWAEALNELEELLAEKNVRAASFLTFGATSTIVQGLALRDIRRVRTAIFVDPTTRSHPSAAMKLVDFLEQKLPLGLPLRSRSKAFDAKPFLQRLRFPALIISSLSGNSYRSQHAKEMSLGMPTSWFLEMDNLDGKKLADTVIQFEDVPAKCPQKNR